MFIVRLGTLRTSICTVLSLSLLVTRSRSTSAVDMGAVNSLRSLRSCSIGAHAGQRESALSIKATSFSAGSSSSLIQLYLLIATSPHIGRSP